MTLMRVASTMGAVLTYDTDDVENIEIDTPKDVIDVTPPGATSYTRELGQAHLVLRVDFKEGKQAVWVDRAEAMFPDVRAGSAMLTAALEAEEVPDELASRIYNRFFFGDPEGLAARRPVELVCE